MDISRHGSQQCLAHYLGRNAELSEMQVDDISISFIKVDLVSMEECWHQPRGKGVGRKLCVVR